MRAEANYEGCEQMVSEAEPDCGASARKMVVGEDSENEELFGGGMRDVIPPREVNRTCAQ
jgi:hypothetical protein